MAIVVDNIASGLSLFFLLQVHKSFEKYQFNCLLAGPYPQLIFHLKAFYLEFNKFPSFFSDHVL